MSLVTCSTSPVPPGSAAGPAGRPRPLRYRRRLPSAKAAGRPSPEPERGRWPRRRCTEREEAEYLLHDYGRAQAQDGYSVTCRCSRRRRAGRGESRLLHPRWEGNGRLAPCVGSEEPTRVTEPTLRPSQRHRPRRRRPKTNVSSGFIFCAKGLAWHLSPN